MKYHRVIFLLMFMDSETMSFAKDSKKLEDTSVFIGDTGATCDATNS